MNLEMIILSEVRQRQISYVDYMWNLKKKKKRHKRTYLQNKNGLTDIENKLMVPKAEGRWEE